MKKNSIILSLVYLPLSILIVICRIFPLKMVLSLGKCLGKAGYYFAYKRRKVAQINLKAAFGEQFDAQRREEIVKALFENIGLNFIELLLFPRLDKNYFNNYVSLENFERFQANRQSKKGIIFLAAHYGNWELSALIAAENGYKMLMIVRPQKPYFLNKILNHYRQMKGCQVIEKGMQMRTIIRCLNENGIVGLLGDQSGRQGKEIDFFKRPVFMAEGAFRIAVATQAVICPFFNIRKGYHHKLVFEEPIIIQKGANAQEQMDKAMMRYRDLLEKYIRMNPEQWFWVNKRWKYTTAKSILILTDGKTGHLRQAQAVADAIIKRFPKSKIVSVAISFKNNFLKNLLTFFVLFSGRFLRTPMPYLRFALTPACYKSLENVFADIIICSGSVTRMPALLLGNENLAKTISIMRPVPFSENCFDLCLIPRHDRPKARKNILVTNGALNLITPEYLKTQVARLKQVVKLKEGLKIGLLIGGDSRYYTLGFSQIEKLFSQIKKFIEENNAQLLLSTSRRTSQPVEEFLKKNLAGFSPCVFKVFPKEKNFGFAVGGILGVCNLVIVSGESISMVSEAASAQTYPIVFIPEKRINTARKKHDLFLENLKKENIIRLIEAENIYDELVLYKNNPVVLRKIDDREKLDTAIKEKILNL